MSKPDETVKVVVRIRPMSSEEERNGNLVAAEAFPDRGLISVRNPKANESEPPKDFFFDAVFAANVEQKHIYEVCASSVVESVLNGYNGTIFAYGQTGAGKTHTMEGRPDPPTLRGIIPNSFQHIFDYVNSAQDLQFLVRASYLEIYNEEIRDLLSKDPKTNLELKENMDSGVYVKDLTSFVVKNVSEIDHVMQAGKKNRSVGATLMNATSSRSHSIFTVVIECGESDARGDHIRVGKLNLVDLAGSERQSKTGATGDRLKEATKINLSLTALGNVITALVDSKSSHVPYRDSKLTRLLQNSLGGNAKTVMCANCGPADYNYDETLSTLRYANRAKNIKNKPKINEDPKDAMLREFQEQIKALKDQLEATQRGVMIDENGKEVPVHNAKREIVEKIVEREVIREVKVGLSKEELKEMQRKAQEEKEYLMKQNAEDMQNMINQHSRTAQERAELQAALDREAEDKKAVEDQKKQLLEKLRMTEEKLIKGGKIISGAKKQEALLRQAEKELRERQAQEAVLARELAEKEEANLQLEEHFSSLQEEVEVKTKKLKKLWNKFQAATREAKDLQEEFQTERTDMLDTIRQLTQTMKLKDLIIANFIPDDTAKSIEKRAAWNAEEDSWNLPKLELSGNNIRAAMIRPVSSTKLRRPETEFARQRKQYDSNPRYKSENVYAMDLDMPERTTQEYAGPGMKSRVEAILGMDLNGDDGDEVAFSNDNVISSPYLTYGNEVGPDKDRGVPDDRTTRGGTGGGDKKVKSSKKKESSKVSSSQQGGSYDNNDVGNGYYQSGAGNGGSSGGASRPKSAARKRDEGVIGGGSGGGGGSSGYRGEDNYRSAGGSSNNKYVEEELYPTARGFVKK